MHHALRPRSETPGHGHRLLGNPPPSCNYEALSQTLQLEVALVSMQNLACAQVPPTTCEFRGSPPCRNTARPSGRGSDVARSLSTHQETGDRE